MPSSDKFINDIDIYFVLLCLAMGIVTFFVLPVGILTIFCFMKKGFIVSYCITQSLKIMPLHLLLILELIHIIPSTITYWLGFGKDVISNNVDKKLRRTRYTVFAFFLISTILLVISYDQEFSYVLITLSYILLSFSAICLALLISIISWKKKQNVKVWDLDLTLISISIPIFVGVAFYTYLFGFFTALGP